MKEPKQSHRMAEKKYPERYTEYNSDLGRYVCPLKYKTDGTTMDFAVMAGRSMYDATEKIIIYKEPDVIFGEVIDRLAEYENEEEEKEAYRQSILPIIAKTFNVPLELLQGKKD